RLFAALAWATSARAAPITVQAEAQPGSVTVGDRVRYRAVFRTAPGVVVAPAFSATSFWDWDVTELKALPPAPDGTNGIVQAFTAVMVPWSATSTGTPALAFTVQVPGAGPHTLTVSPAAVKVISVLATAKDAGEPRPLKGVIGFRSWWPWILGALAVIVAAGGWWWWRRVRRRRAAEAAGLDPSVTAVPPQIAAREALAALLASGLLEEGSIKPFYIELSDILRRYLEGRVGVPALDRTTAELLPALRGLPALRAILPEIRVFLDECDLVKFAKYVPDPADVQADIARLRRCIDETSPAGTAVEARA
ncbi:MAG: hypothetical protein AAB368_16800, partial [bacterium]